MRRIKPYFPLSHGVPRVDDRRIASGIIFAIRDGLRWRGAPREYGPHKTIYNRFIRWSRLGVLDKIFAALAAKDGRLREAGIVLVQGGPRPKPVAGSGSRSRPTTAGARSMAA